MIKLQIKLQRKIKKYNQIMKNKKMKKLSKESKEILIKNKLKT